MLARVLAALRGWPGRFAARVGDAQPDQRGREQEDAPDEQRPLEARGECVSCRRVRGEQVVGPTELAKRAGLHSATMTGILDRLAQGGWIVPGT